MTRYVLIVIFFILNDTYSQEKRSVVLLHEKDATVWLPEQNITGEVLNLKTEKVIIHHNENSFSVNISDGHKFSYNLLLDSAENKIWVEVPGYVASSDTINYKLGYTPVPLVKPFATVKDQTVELRSTIISNPTDEVLNLIWRPDSNNPAVTEVEKLNDSLSSVILPKVSGDYFFNLFVLSEDDTTKYQTMVRREEGKIVSINIDEEYPKWMDEAILYQITPYSFVQDGSFKDITSKLNELQQLGVNTIWLQPITETGFGGQGYDVTNYTKINPKFGTDEELRLLVSKAKELGLRVMFDVVLNHSSIRHPYAKDRMEKGEDSYYYDFYQREDDGADYSSHYTFDDNFINYFWEHLPNLNYDNEEVQRWMLEACKYWVREFDIDGYRLDAIWGVNARNPSFSKRLRVELKSIKPDLLLLAEDKGSDPQVYELGFDAAYDWTRDTTWVSQWSWEYEYSEHEIKTIFNHPDPVQRGVLMRQALFENGGNNHRKLYYLENNDLPSFVLEHGLRRTEMASALLFALPGIPMLYNGQEIGHRGHPYSTSSFFKRDNTIRSMDEEGLFAHYQRLINLHKQYPALSGTEMSPLSVSPESPLVAFHRFKKDENFIIVMNLSKDPTSASIELNKALQTVVQPQGQVLRDVLTGENFELEQNALRMEIPMEGYSVKWLLITGKNVEGRNRS